MDGYAINQELAAPGMELSEYCDISYPLAHPFQGG